MNKRIILIPGWMQTLDSYKIYNGLDIWKKKVYFDRKVSADYIVGHSIGTIVALLLWEKNKNSKLILVNPPFSRKKGVWRKFWRWLKFHFNEKIRPGREIARGIRRKIEGIKLFRSLLDVDVIAMLNKIPVESIVIIRGKEDYYFCDEEVCGLLQEKGIKIVELDGVGHDWHENIDREIKKIINNNK